MWKLQGGRAAYFSNHCAQKSSWAPLIDKLPVIVVHCNIINCHYLNVGIPYLLYEVCKRRNRIPIFNICMDTAECSCGGCQWSQIYWSDERCFSWSWSWEHVFGRGSPSDSTSIKVPYTPRGDLLSLFNSTLYLSYLYFSLLPFPGNSWQHFVFGRLC